MRVVRQRPVVRVCSELALVGIITESPGRGGGEWIIKALKELVCFFSLQSRFLVWITHGPMEN